MLRRLLAGGVVLCAALTGATVATGSAARPGGWYYGHLGTRSYAGLLLSPDGGRVQELHFTFTHGRCSDGKRLSDSFPHRIRQGAPIDASGHLSYSFLARRAWELDRAGRRVNGRERLVLTATFSGERVSGTFHVTFVSGRLKCASGGVAFVAYRDGTPRAPVATDSVVSGHYRVRSGGTRIKLYVFVPWKVLILDRMAWRESCRSGATTRSSVRVWHAPLGAHFAFRGRAVSRSRGLILRDRWRLTGVFARDAGGRYQVTAALHARTLVFRGRRLVTRCSLDAAGMQGLGRRLPAKFV